MTERQEKRKLLRHFWSHEHPIHRYIVRKVNKVLFAIPDTVKHTVGARIRRSKEPYCSLKSGSVAIQIGAPWDTLKAGRSRAMHFANIIGNMGKVLVIEPDENSVKHLRRWSYIQGLCNVHVIQLAAWSHEEILEIYIDDEHPATSFTRDKKEYDAKRMSQYRRVLVPATTIDRQVKEAELNRVDLISVTTNGAEIEILKGAAETIAMHYPIISLARTSNKNTTFMETLGYGILTADDRGYTYEPL